MHCPKCGLAESKVIDTREAQDGSFIKRRRACSSCGYRFSTIEKIEFEFPYVVKRNGSIVEFDCDKIKKSLCKAMDKELCSDRIINGMLSKILSRIVDLRTEKVESQFIGQVIMDENVLIQLLTSDLQVFIKTLNLRKNLLQNVSC